jgi:DDE superfamily endonuclease
VEKQDVATTAVASIEDAAECGERADALIRGLLARVMRQRRTVETALEYIRVLSRDARANCWELALKAGHARPYRMQSLLGRCAWSWEEVRELLPGLAQQVLRDDPDDLIGPGLAFDETADLRKGKLTACVAPQHADVTGKVENCVTWVFAALVIALGQAWVDFDVYMPKCWAADPARRSGSSQCELFIRRLQRSGGRCRPSLQPEPVMTLPRTAAEVLSAHVRLEIRCTDRVLLTLRQPRLQYGQGIHGFFASTAATSSSPRR